MMHVFLLVVLCLPCLLLFNESHTFIPNLIGLCYVILLAVVGRTTKGKKFFNKAFSECDKLNDKFVAWLNK